MCLCFVLFLIRWRLLLLVISFYSIFFVCFGLDRHLVYFIISFNVCVCLSIFMSKKKKKKSTKSFHGCKNVKRKHEQSINVDWVKHLILEIKKKNWIYWYYMQRVMIENKNKQFFFSINRLYNFRFQGKFAAFISF